MSHDISNALSEEGKAAFQALLQRLQIRDVQLLSSTTFAARPFVAAHGNLSGGVEVGLEIEGQSEVLDGPRRLECVLHFEWAASAVNDDADLVSVKETYLLTYDLKGDEPVQEQTLRDFAHHNAAFNAWPFFRESLHSTTLRMGLPAYTLPLLKPA